MEASNGNHKSEEKIDMYQPLTEPPKWMTRDYVQDVMRDIQKDSKLSLTDYQIRPATKPGDNFASVALRLKATFESEGVISSKSFIVKVMHFEEGFKKEMMANAALFETEIEVYTKTIPEMQKILEEANIHETIAPKVSFSSLEPHKIVFIEDISPEFIMSKQQLDYEASVEIFEKIATFHALSYHLGEDHPPMNDYVFGFISERVPGTEGFLKQNVSHFAETVGEWGGQFEEIAQKLMDIVPTIHSKCLASFKKDQVTGFNVLNHGDYHIKNILFRDQEHFPDATDKTRLIDFQLAVWATPAIDLIFALYGMVGHEARERRDDLIRAYHARFAKVLKLVGTTRRIPSLLDVQVELLRHGVLEIFMVTFFMIMFYTNHEEMAKRGAMTEAEMMDCRKKDINQPELKAAIMKLLPVFNDKGFLEA